MLQIKTETPIDGAKVVLWAKGSGWISNVGVSFYQFILDLFQLLSVPARVMLTRLSPGVWMVTYRNHCLLPHLRLATMPEKTIL